MKKIIAFILILTLSAFCFAACTKDNDQKPENPTPETPATVTTTVTKAEWDANFNAKNFTINGTAMGETAVLKQTDTACAMQSSEEDTVYYLLADGKCYSVSLEGGKWEAIESDEWEPRALIIWSMNTDDISYDDFTYNESEKAYVYTVEHATATVRFENGVVKSLVITYEGEPDMTRSFTFSNIGTTTITVPEYEIVEQ